MKELKGKTAVVTGAGSGLGRAMAVVLARAGMNIAVLDIERAWVDDTCRLVEEAGTHGSGVVVDVSDRSSVARAAAEVEAVLGPVHVVCNNAGVGFRAPVHETPDEIVDWLFAVNVIGAFNVVKAFIPAMIERGEEGHMVVTASENALFELPKHQNGIYCATKMALWGMTASMREELAPHKIGVTAFCPGLADTNSRQSGRHRPERFGGPFDRADQKREKAGLDPMDAGFVVLRAIQDNEAMATTHPISMRDHVLERDQRILGALDHWEHVLPELGVTLHPEHL